MDAGDGLHRKPASGGRYAQQEATCKACGKEDVVLDKFLGLLEESGQLAVCAPGQLVLCLLEVLVEPRPVHLHVTLVLRNLEKQQASSNGCGSYLPSLRKHKSHAPSRYASYGELLGRRGLGGILKEAHGPRLAFGTWLHSWS